MSYIPAKLRQDVTERAKGFCEYCQADSRIIITMEIDHIKPESDGGETVSDNLCFSCPSCNGFKHDFQTGIDPDNHTEIPLYNPRQQRWSEHFKWDESGTQLIGLTPVGKATIMRLKINRKEVVIARQRWVAAGWHPPSDL